MAEIPPTFICEPRQRRVNQALIAGMTGATTGVIIAGAATGSTRYIVAVAAGAITVAGVIRAFRLSLRASSERVWIRNYFRTHEFPWSEVSEVAIGVKTMGVVPQSAFAFLVRQGESYRDLRAQATPPKAYARQAALRDLRRVAPSNVRFTAPG